MKNITVQIKEAIAVNALWRISDFFYFIEILNGAGFKISYWKDEENWATLLHNGEVITYIWQKYPLIFVREDCVEDLKMFIKELNYIIVIESKDLVSNDFTLDMDEDLINRISCAVNTKSFSANDFWFHTNH